MRRWLSSIIYAKPNITSHRGRGLEHSGVVQIADHPRLCALYQKIAYMVCSKAYQYKQQVCYAGVEQAQMYLMRYRKRPNRQVYMCTYVGMFVSLS